MSGYFWQNHCVVSEEFYFIEITVSIALVIKIFLKTYLTNRVLEEIILGTSLKNLKYLTSHQMI